MNFFLLQPSFLSSKPDPPPARPIPIPVSDNTHFRVISTGQADDDHCLGDGESSLHQFLPTTMSSPQERTEMGDAGDLSDRIAAGDEPEMTRKEAETVAMLAACQVSDVGERGVASVGSRPQGKTDSPSKRKDKRSCHLGSDGVYLDEITELGPEVAALYFPKSEHSGVGQVCCEGTLRSMSTSPPSVGSSGADSGVDSYADQPTDLSSISLSLCGGLTDSQKISKEHFQEKVLSYQQFAENPKLIDDPNLVVKIGSKYHNWSTAAPILLAMQVFQKPLPK
ncbi:phosphatidate phosphatase LPIN1-like isoform X1, partial [Tachysurus ichikawai]